MNNLNFHIAYLLTKHECVIIPDFGAFIASSASAMKDKETGVFCSPAQVLGFNPEIKHNDGLLANSLCLEKAISYKEANLLIKQFTNQISEQLNAGKTIDILWLGNLSLSLEHKIIFKPATRLSCNAPNFGLSNFYFPFLKELESTKELIQEENRHNIIMIPISRRIVKWTGSVAALILGFFLVSTPLNNLQNIQNASIIIPSSVNKFPVVENEEESFVVVDNLPAKDLVEEIEIVAMPIPANNGRHYYIVVSSLPTKALAEKKLQEIQKEGFPQASIIGEGDRHRVYVKEFDNKQEAEAVLKNFKIENPNHSDAWLLSQRYDSDKK
jgi:nucleoid DNA-binding protein